MGTLFAAPIRCSSGAERLGPLIFPNTPVRGTSMTTALVTYALINLVIATTATAMS